jgi:hypothetical protein
MAALLTYIIRVVEMSLHGEDEMFDVDALGSGEMRMDGDEKVFEAKKTEQEALSSKCNEVLHKSSIFSI